jgi:hypothetical protein
LERVEKSLKEVEKVTERRRRGKRGEGRGKREEGRGKRGEGRGERGEGRGRGGEEENIRSLIQAPGPSRTPRSPPPKQKRLQNFSNFRRTRKQGIPFRRPERQLAETSFGAFGQEHGILHSVFMNDAPPVISFFRILRKA